MPSALDHLVLAVPDLEAAVVDMASRTGVEPVLGGSHPGMGTRNAFIGLVWRGDHRCYLELLGPDPDQPDVEPEATMLGLGSLGDDFAPRLHAWAVRPVDLARTIARAGQAGVDVGTPVAASRTTVEGEHLSWQLAVPRPLGLGGVQPFLIDWGHGPHPGDGPLPRLELVDLELRHPRTEDAARVLALLGVDLPVVASASPGLRATVDTPRGRLVLA